MRSAAGYSLVELVVTITVLGIVAAIAVPTFQASIANAQIRTVAESIRNGLQQARMEAVKRNTKVKFSLSTDSSWSIGCVTTSTTCPSVIASKNANEGSSSNITIVANSYNVTFSGFGTKDASTSSALSLVTVSNSAVSSAQLKSLRVTLSAGGYSKLCDPAISTSGDPRKC